MQTTRNLAYTRLLLPKTETQMSCLYPHLSKTLFLFLFPRQDADERKWLKQSMKDHRNIKGWWTIYTSWHSCVCVLRSASFLQVTLTLLDSDISIDISSFIINIAREQKRVSRVFVVRGRSVNAVTECLYLSEISSHIASQRFSFFNEKSWCKNVRKRPFLAFREAK